MTILTIIACRQEKKENVRNNQIPKNNINHYSGLTTSEEDTDSLTKLLKFRKEGLDLEYKDYQMYNLSEIILEDFNGDGTLDKAEFRKQNKSGIIITDGRTNNQTKIGFGRQFAHMTDFDWVTYWGVLKDTTTYEITFDNETGDILGDTTVFLKNKSIFVKEDEVGGGVITYENESYKWIHQCD